MLAIPLMAAAFGAHPSIGMLTLLLLMGDCFAIAWYRHHARWDKLRELLPWVLVGVGLGAGFLSWLGRHQSSKNWLNLVIGVLVLVILGLHLIRNHLGERFQLHSRAGTLACGSAAGFATTTANAAGPIMSLYMTSMGLGKDQFMGTTSWYYFLINLLKVPVYMVLTVRNPQAPMMTLHTLWFALVMFPLIFAGAYIGRSLLQRFSQSVFDTLVLVLAAAFALKLIFT